MGLPLNHNSRKVELTALARKRELDAWFVREGILKKDVAKKMGVLPQRFSAILNGRYVRQEHLNFLIKFGIPPELLPPVSERKKPGPKRKDTVFKS